MPRTRRPRPSRIPLPEGTSPQAPLSPAAPDADDQRNAFERRSLVERAIARLPVLQTRLLEAFHFERRPVAVPRGGLAPIVGQWPCPALLESGPGFERSAQWSVFGQLAIGKNAQVGIGFLLAGRFLQ